MKNKEKYQNDYFFSLSGIEEEHYELEDNIHFSIIQMINSLNQNIDNDFQRKFFQKSTIALFDSLKEQHPDNWENTKPMILYTLICKIQSSQDIKKMHLLSHLIDDKNVFNPLLTSNIPIFNIDKRTINNENEKNSKPVIMELFDQYHKDLSFILDYMDFFKPELPSKPEILFGKEMFSESNILFKSKKYSVNQWWEPIHFNLYQVNDFHEINKEDFIKEQTNKYFELFEEKTGVVLEETENDAGSLLKILLSAMLEENLSKQFNENAMKYGSEEKFSAEELSNQFINSLKNTVSENTNPEQENNELSATETLTMGSDSSEQKFDYKSIIEQPVIREIIMLEIFSRFEQNDIEQVKEKLLAANLYPNQEEMKQIFFIIMHPDFSGRSGPQDLIRSNYTVINNTPELKKLILPYINNFSESRYPNSALSFVLEEKMALEHNRFEKWLSSYTHSFSCDGGYKKERSQIWNAFTKDIKRYLTVIYDFAENSQYPLDVMDVKNKVEDITENFIKSMQNTSPISRDDPEMIELSTIVEGMIIKQNLKIYPVDTKKPKKRL